MAEARGETAGLRVGTVAYLNARPLTWGLDRPHPTPRIELSCAVPAALADGMAEGRYDLALLPVVELVRLGALEVVPGLGITTRGPSRSVLLVSRRPPAEVETLALDPESRTSNVLARLLLARVWGREQPACVALGGALEDVLQRCDAAVRIGDKALFEPPPAGCHVEDLGAVWTAATGLPFVYAVWAARTGVVDRALYARLHDSRRAGVRHIDEIADAYTWRGERHPALARTYLREHIRYRLGSDELRALERFFDVAAAAGLVACAPPIRLALARATDCDALAAAVREAP
jgi:predicted solute-binding protein